jgi:Glu-tRNA(Gln) amidotransferase subunit E-like FAD-binding protein
MKQSGKVRMVLVQVDGKLSVAEMAVKIGNVQLVEDALRKLEEGGFIAPSQNGGNCSNCCW